MSVNDVTGDKLTTGHSTDKYRSGWDGIDWGKPKEKPKCPWESKPWEELTDEEYQEWGEKMGFYDLREDDDE